MASYDCDREMLEQNCSATIFGDDPNVVPLLREHDDSWVTVLLMFEASFPQCDHPESNGVCLGTVSIRGMLDCNRTGHNDTFTIRLPPPAENVFTFELVTLSRVTISVIPGVQTPHWLLAADVGPALAQLDPASIKEHSVALPRFTMRLHIPLSALFVKVWGADPCVRRWA